MATLAAICLRGFWAALFAMFFLASVSGNIAEAQDKVRLGPARTSVPKEPITLQQAKARLASNLYRGNLGNRALFANPRVMPAGTRIASWKRPDQVVVDQNSWFFFVDEKPGAKWEHQASYVLVNQKTGQVRRIYVTTPPMNIIALEPQNKKAGWQKELLRRNLGGGRRVTRFAADDAGRLWVYGRKDQPCLRCEAPIVSARLGRHHRGDHLLDRRREHPAHPGTTRRPTRSGGRDPPRRALPAQRGRPADARGNESVREGRWPRPQRQSPRLPPTTGTRPRHRPRRVARTTPTITPAALPSRLKANNVV